MAIVTLDFSDIYFKKKTTPLESMPKQPIHIQMTGSHLLPVNVIKPQDW